MVISRSTCLLALLVVVVGSLGCGEGEPLPAQVSGPRGDTSTTSGRGRPRPALDETSPGEGFVVWESNRSGDWRIWTRRLDGSGLRRLTPDPPGRQHCCPHLSPDGRSLAYLEYAGRAADKYPEGGFAGALHLLDLKSGEERVVAQQAGTYYENRAVVWLEPDLLIHIGAGGHTYRLELASGESRRIVERRPEDYGWLINRTLGHATTNRATFSLFDAASRTVIRRTEMGGCQPYFSHDGRWGFWTAGAGGPLRRIELASRTVSDILLKNDSRIEDGLGYLYFPMFSRDGMLFAFAGSRGGHDHITSDYEVFVAESDPETLELLGPPRRMTFDPGTDRYPDVYLEPLALGRHRGEAPLTVDFDALVPAAGPFRWSFGDGSAETEASGRHTFAVAGAYDVTATSGDAILEGRVIVAPAMPPKPIDVDVTEGGKRVVVRFDEPIRPASPEITFDSGRGVAGWSVGGDGRSLEIDLVERFRGLDRLRLGGIPDRAQIPNELESALLEVEPPIWPASRDGLVFLWETGNAANLVFDPELGADRAQVLKATGLARFDRHHAMLLGGGAFRSEAEAASRIRQGMRDANAMTLEATLRPTGPRSSGEILSMASSRGQLFRLFQRQGELVLSLRVGGRGPEANPVLRLFTIPATSASHVAVSYSPGRLRAYLDGAKKVDLGYDRIHGDLFHWKREMPLVFGSQGGGGSDWDGGLEGIALYSRELAAEEIRESFLRYRTKLDRRPEVARLVVDARLAARSPAPTLGEISPYREALAVFEYRVERVVEGELDGDRIRVAHWSLLDGRRLALNDAAEGQVYRLSLERFGDNPQLESLYLADAIGGASGTPLLYASDPILKETE